MNPGGEVIPGLTNSAMLNVCAKSSFEIFCFQSSLSVVNTWLNFSQRIVRIDWTEQSCSTFSFPAKAREEEEGNRFRIFKDLLAHSFTYTHDVVRMVNEAKL